VTDSQRQRFKTVGQGSGEGPVVAATTRKPVTPAPAWAEREVLRSAAVRPGTPRERRYYSLNWEAVLTRAAALVRERLSGRPG